MSRTASPTLPTLEQLSKDLVKFTVGDLEVWFSFETPIAFRRRGKKLAVSKNVWSAKTGAHLNLIDGGNRRTAEGREAAEARLDHERFTHLLEFTTALA